LEAAPEPGAPIIIFGSQTEEIPTAEVAQLLKMYFADSPLYFVSDDRKVIDKKLFLKNGSDDVFLLPADTKPLEHKLQDDITTASSGQQMFLRPVSLIDIEAGEQLGFDLYIHLPANCKYIRYCAANEPLDAERARRLETHRIKSIYVKTNQMAAFYKASAKKLKDLQSNTTLSQTEIKDRREKAIRSLLTDVLQGGAGDDSFEKGQRLLGDCRSIVTSYVCGDQPGSSWYQKMMSLAEEQESTYGSAANAATFAALLSIGLGIGNPEEVSLAALLHDIGLVDLPPQLLSKPETDWTPEDRSLYQTHPELSLKIIKDRKIPVSDTVIKAIQQHHESFDGTGYPKGIPGIRICAEAQLIALAGCLDEWCRVVPGKPRQEPLKELEALDSQYSKNPAAAKFDPKLIKKTLSLFNGSADKSNSEAVA
ncbi:MAG TPA: HD domain-containing phosphohydrolase, partial [Bdellovibrionales bacterium]|nr:HD domain-containing phosphohydrolase [Bdellovibrionales bacterium]